MAVYTGINVGGTSNEELADSIIALNRTLEYQMANIDDDNIRELDYSKMVGGPPANADKTSEVLTVGGSNFTIVNGAYVYSGPANYSQISGGPPADADNTNLNLPASLGIKFTKIGSTYIYTGELSANQINAGTLNANYINGGSITGILIRTSNTTGRRIEMNTAGFKSYDATNILRIAIENDGSSDTNHAINFYSQSGALVGNLAGYNGYLQLLAEGNLYLHGSTGIRVLGGTPFFDFANVEIRNFTGGTAKFG